MSERRLVILASRASGWVVRAQRRAHSLARRAGIVLALIVCCSFGVSTSYAQEKSLDEQLFEDLQGQPLPDVPPQDTAPETPRDDVDQQLQRELGGEDIGQPSGSSPLRLLADTMQQVQRRLQGKDLATETQQIQGRIVGDLDKLIEQLRQQKQQSQSGGGQQQKKQQQQQRPSNQPPQQPSQQQSGKQPGNKPSNQPANDSTTRLGSAETAQVSEETRDQMMQDAWGNLPASTQEQMRSARPEKFLPKYSRLIEEYFRRLAEERKK